VAEEATPHESVGAVLQERMRDAIRRAGWVSAGLVVLVGDRAVTEAAWDGVLDPVPGEWRRVWRPPDAGALLGGLRAVEPLAAWTVVRLDDLRRFLLPEDVDLGVEVAASLRGAFHVAADRPLLVAAAMPPDQDSWRVLTQVPASGGRGRRAQSCALLRGATVLTAHAEPVPWVPGSWVPGSWVPGSAPSAPSAPSAAAEVAEVAEQGVARESLGELPAEAVRGAGIVVCESQGRAVEAGGTPEGTVGGTPEGAAVPGKGTVRVAGPAAAPERRTAPARRPRPASAGRPDWPRWRPTALPPPKEDEPVESLRERGLRLERAGNREGAERLYEQAAQVGDLLALARLAALRAGGTPSALSSEVADRMYAQAAAEGNTAVLFCLAAAGHTAALRLLARLKEEAGAGAGPSRDQPGSG
jgi:hypothetical protein